MTTAHIHDASTGETIVRDMTEEEIEVMEKSMKEAKKVEAAEQAKIAARQAVLDKLGLTADEAAALLG